MKQKIIFLDFDGVITTQKSGWKICPDKIKLLGDIINANNCQIVISSSWRYGNIEDTIKYIEPAGFTFCDKIIGVTPKLTVKYLDSYYSAPRGMEIEKWIQWNLEQYYIDKYTFNYCIIDDESDMLYWQKDNFVKTNSYIGLTTKSVNKAIRILNK